MTANSTPQQTVQVKDTAAARKRRRRAPAGGASDDCFTCSKRGVKCDRRRPYCSQCLEVGNECSGYKTQLTWGVGVASRGKLRGLSLPIAKAPPVSREPPKKASGRTRASSTATTTSAGSAVQWPEADDRRSVNLSHRGPIDIPQVSHATAASTPATPYGLPGGYDYMSMHHHEHSPPMHGSWGSIHHYSPHMVHSPPEVHPRYSKFPLALVTDGLSSSVSSVNSDMDYMSPMSHSYPREEHYIHSPGLMYDNYSTHQSSPVPQSPPSSLVIDQHTRAPTSYPGLVYTPPDTSGHSHLDVFESQMSQKMMVRECGDSLNVPDVHAYQQKTAHHQTRPGSAWNRAEDGGGSSSAHERSNSLWSTTSHAPSMSRDLLDWMPFFMDYYTNTLCASMVYVDGPSNPFREDIMALAQGSPSLQHAICALAACNLRMKRKVSLGQDTYALSAQLRSEKHNAEATTDTEIPEQSLSEEYQHRNLAVHLLNQQLNDAAKATHDSVLATILLLCHYRMVESGIAKFQTQFAGVKKIIAMRKSRAYASQREPNWMEGLFAHFDAISASINNREAQLIPPFSGFGPEPQLLSAGAENLVGCEHELFQIISKLGRLNLLAQHRHVASNIEPLKIPHGRFDGNGFGSTLNDEEIRANARRQSGPFEHQRSSFWKEWKECHLALQNWQFDSAIVAASLPGSASPSHVRDLGSLSEAWRYAALLYIERLANPVLPSSHSSFQNLVSQVVYYATSLERESSAEKFLLWPMFVAGSECVNELQQNIVRTKCREMMTRSGYMNSLSALEVLETLWASELKDTEMRNPGARLPLNVSRRGPFNWAKFIGAGTSSEVEWIMC